MSASRLGRLWLIGGALVALVLTAVTYLLFIAPARSEVASIQSQTDDATVQQVTERRKLNQLKADAAQIGSVKADLAAARAALPETTSSADFLRTLQTVSQGEGVVVTAVTIGSGGNDTTTSAAPAPDATGLVQVPVRLEVAGGLDGLDRFLDQLQSVQPRAVTVAKADVTTTSSEHGGAGWTLHLELTMFVAPVGG